MLIHVNRPRERTTTKAEKNARGAVMASDTQCEKTTVDDPAAPPVKSARNTGQDLLRGVRNEKSNSNNYATNHKPTRAGR